MAPRDWTGVEPGPRDRPPRRRAGSGRSPAPGPLDSARRSASWWLKLWQVWWERAAGPPAVEAAAKARLDALVRHARAHSPVYRDACRGLPDGPVALDRLPVMTKHALMTRFDDWVTDPAIRRAGVHAFLADRSQVGERYLGRYVIWKSSGTSGEPGIYVQDDDALTVYDALIAVQLARVDLASRCLIGFMGRGGRAALIAATGDHFASIASWKRVGRAAPGLYARGFSVMDPIDDLVAALNDFAPAYLASYPTMLAVLTDERIAGRLTIEPALVWSGGEYLSPAGHAALERAFACPVVNEYGASECLSIAFGCSKGWLHVNADWVLVEPVDADYRPTPRGEVSHTVLLTNLANRVQPVIRYDLGDSVLAHPGRCACGNPLPAIRVHGRCEDILTVVGDAGQEIRLVPMALATLVEDAADVYRFQIVKSGARRLALRLDHAAAPRHRQAIFERAARALQAHLERHGAHSVEIVLDASSPRRDRNSGKLRQVDNDGMVDRRSPWMDAMRDPPRRS